MQQDVRKPVVLMEAINECFWFHAHVSGQMCTRVV